MYGYSDLSFDDLDELAYEGISLEDLIINIETAIQSKKDGAGGPEGLRVILQYLKKLQKQQ